MGKPKPEKKFTKAKFEYLYRTADPDAIRQLEALREEGVPYVDTITKAIKNKSDVPLNDTIEAWITQYQKTHNCSRQEALQRGMTHFIVCESKGKPPSTA